MRHVTRCPVPRRPRPLIQYISQVTLVRVRHWYHEYVRHEQTEINWARFCDLRVTRVLTAFVWKYY